MEFTLIYRFKREEHTYIGKGVKHAGILVQEGENSIHIRLVDGFPYQTLIYSNHNMNTSNK